VTTPDPSRSSSRSSLPRLAALVWFAVAVTVLVIGFRQAIFLVPTEATMGNVQRIFYYHLPSAILGMVFPYINFAASLAFLYWRNRDPLKALSADALAVASAELTVVFVSIGLLTGSLWARPAWGIWWTWDARTTTYLVLWLLFVSYLITRRFSSASGQGHTLAAVLSVFAAVDVPISFMSIRWWRTQHPAPVFGGDGSLDPSFFPAVRWNLAGWALWGFLVLAIRYALERRRQFAEQQAALEAIEASLEITQ
jgi:heme exporter protein C